jgi:hypothetical protein
LTGAGVSRSIRDHLDADGKPTDEHLVRAQTEKGRYLRAAENAADLNAVAKLALADRPQLREVLGILER